MNSFDRYAFDSNVAGYKALNDICPDNWKIEIVQKKRSINDIVITTDKNETILVEVKLRKKHYETILLEKSKADGLLKKQKLTNSVDSWYLSVADDGTYYCFSLKSIFDKPQKNAGDTPIKLKDSVLWNDSVLLAYMYAPQYTAKESGYIKKHCYFIPISFAKQKLKEVVNTLF